MNWREKRTRTGVFVSKFLQRAAVSTVSNRLHDPIRDFRDNCGFALLAHMDGEKSHWLVETTLESLARLTHRGAVGADPLAGDGAGIAGVPTVGFGPSSEHQAHVVDEYIELEHLFAAARGYQGIIESVLG